jgi:hypothetical protein
VTTVGLGASARWATARVAPAWAQADAEALSCEVCEVGALRVAVTASAEPDAATAKSTLLVAITMPRWSRLCRVTLVSSALTPRA